MTVYLLGGSRRATPSPGHSVDEMGGAMKTALSDLMKEVAGRAVVDVFQSYDIKLKERRNSVPMAPLIRQGTGAGALVAGLVGFSGAELRGSTVLATTFELASLARPVILRKRALSANLAADWIFVRDWVGELCNQAIGRIKNRVHRYGIVFDVSPPVAFSGPALACALPKGPAAHEYAFGVDHYTVWFALNADYDGDVTKEVSSGPTERVLSEGQVVVFD